MNDVMLFARLKDLGIPKQQAWDLTASIRDQLHPIAAVAASKIHAKTGLSQALPLAGLVGARGMTVTMTTLQDASLGAKVGSVVPVIGTAVGAIVGGAIGLIGSVFGPAKLGQASVTWNDCTQHRYLLTQRGATFDERYFGECLKGAMDEGNNIWPGGGPDGHKNPDAFYGPFCQQIIQGYMANAVTLTATAGQVYAQIIVPWLTRGAGGLFNWANAVAEQQQQGLPLSQQELLMQAACDRYINGMPITRADMPSYAGQGYNVHTPSLNAALQSLTVTTNAGPANVSQSIANAPVTNVPAPIANAGTQLANSVIAQGTIPTLSQTNAANISPVISAPSTLQTQYMYDAPTMIQAPATDVLTPAQNTTAALMGGMISGSTGVNMVSPEAQQVLADVSANGVQTTIAGPPIVGSMGGMLPTLLIAGGAGLALWLVLKKSKAA